MCSARNNVTKLGHNQFKRNYTKKTRIGAKWKVFVVVIVVIVRKRMCMVPSQMTHALHTPN